jgi:hypothetical protein
MTMGVGAIFLIIVVILVVGGLAVMLTGVGAGVRHRQEQTPGSDVISEPDERTGRHTRPAHTQVGDDGSDHGSSVG